MCGQVVAHISKQICVLSEDLKGTIEPNVLYSAGGFGKLGRGDFEIYTPTYTRAMMCVGVFIYYTLKNNIPIC